MMTEPAITTYVADELSPICVFTGQGAGGGGTSNVD